MPELPEVETIACDLRAANLPGRTVEGVRIYQPLSVRGPVAAVEGVAGRRIESVGRHGKLLLIALSGGATLVFHLKMTGQIYLIESDAPLLKHTRVAFELEGGEELRFRDTRRFGYVALMSPEGLQAVLAPLGPDALFVRLPEFRARLGARRTMLKPLLTDQGFVAGVGNIYANEMLFEARLNPWRRSDELSAAQARRLYEAMRRVLREAIRCRGSSISDYVDAAGRPGAFQERHRVYQRQRCPECGAEIRREVRGGRPAFWCPRCQSAST
jgi:formamidopyrimidine-DNA glycosylase